MLHLSASVTYYFYSQAVDMRKGFDSLSGLVQQQMRLDVLNGGVFIFINKKLMGTCKLHDINPFIWLKVVLERIATHPINKISEPLPYNWKLVQ